MARVDDGTWLGSGVWADEDDPGAGSQDFTTGYTGTGLNANFIKYKKALTEFFSGYGVVLPDKITGSSIQASAADGSTLEKSGSSFRIKDAGVTEAKIATGAVTGLKIGINSVANSHIIDGSITSSKLVDLSVLTSKLNASAVTAEKIATSAVTTEKLEYKEFFANISQFGTSAPILTVMRNTIGTITATRADVGEYELVTSGLFLSNKTVCLISNTVSIVSINSITHQTENVVVIDTRNISGQLADSLLYVTSVMIRVYP
jgi:hypothetical protein